MTHITTLGSSVAHNAILALLVPPVIMTSDEEVNASEPRSNSHFVLVLSTIHFRIAVERRTGETSAGFPAFDVCGNSRVESPKIHKSLAGISQPFSMSQAGRSSQDQQALSADG